MSQVYSPFEARNLLRNVALLTLVVYLIVGCGASGEGHSVRKVNEDPSRDRENKVASIVSRMSVGDMVGQMFVVSVGGTQPDYYIEKMVRERNIGGVILFAYNMKSEEQVESLTGRLQRLSMQTEPAVPLFVAVDQEGGDIASAPWVAPQPAAAEVGSRGDPEEAHDIAATMGRQLLRAGINTNFAPVVDTGFGAAIGNRSYGEDPELVARMGAAAVEGFEEAGVVSAAKHFPNHGPATSDSHVSLPVIRHDDKDPRVLRPAAFRGRHRGRGAHGDGRASRLPGHRPPQSCKPLQRCHKHVAWGSWFRRGGRHRRSGDGGGERRRNSGRGCGQGRRGGG